MIGIPDGWKDLRVGSQACGERRRDPVKAGECLAQGCRQDVDLSDCPENSPSDLRVEDGHERRAFWIDLACVVNREWAEGVEVQKSALFLWNRLGRLTQPEEPIHHLRSGRGLRDEPRFPRLRILPSTARAAQKQGVTAAGGR
jgi:hypothetical protein